MEFASNYYELKVYKLAQELAFKIFELTKSFPKEERYSLTDQVRRSSRSIGAQIAEAWAKRKYEKHFVSKLTDAHGEQLETEHWIQTALKCKYLKDESARELMEGYLYVGKMINSMITKSHIFCRNL